MRCSISRGGFRSNGYVDYRPHPELGGSSKTWKISSPAAEDVLTRRISHAPVAFSLAYFVTFSPDRDLDRLDLDQPADDKPNEFITMRLMHLQVHIVTVAAALTAKLAHQAVKAQVVAELKDIARPIAVRRVAVLASDHQEPCNAIAFTCSSFPACINPGRNSGASRGPCHG